MMKGLQSYLIRGTLTYVARKKDLLDACSISFQIFSTGYLYFLRYTCLKKLPKNLILKHEVQPVSSLFYLFSGKYAGG
jgi:hypothetical protein